MKTTIIAKGLLILTIAGSSTCALFSQEIADPSACALFSQERVDVTARASCFRPGSRKIRKIYGRYWARYDVEATLRLSQNWKALLGCGYMYKSGRTAEMRDKTKLRMIPISIGLQRSFAITEKIGAYVGIGGTYSMVHIKDYAAYVKKNNRSQRWGGFARSGIRYMLNKHIHIDGYISYFHQRFHFSRLSDYPNIKRGKVNLCGVSAGVAIGVHF